MWYNKSLHAIKFIQEGLPGIALEEMCFELRNLSWDEMEKLFGWTLRIRFQAHSSYLMNSFIFIHKLDF